MSASVVDILEDQHRRLAELLDRVSSPDEDRPAVLHTILQELAAHVAAERAAVRPVVAKEGIGDDLAGHLDDEYDRMEKLMVLIERRKFNSPDVPGLVTELKAVVDEHDQRARAELIPGLRETLSPEEQVALGEKVAGEDAMITSHPHPHLLSLGPIADTMTRVAQKWDGARDRTVINRQHPEEGDDGGDDGHPVGRALKEFVGISGGDEGEAATGDSGDPVAGADPSMGGAT